MLYDVFISHASEDKDDFVRPLAEALRKERIEVWYDEFSLTPGMSLRRSIDLGLAKSRFGIVVLSPHFFNKSWPEWELNGLIQRHLFGSHNVLLPLWHGVSRDEVASYSPSLADIYAMRSTDGIARVTEQTLQIVQPSGSALVRARNLILERGFEPPVISDDWWLDAIEGAEGQHGSRWCFPYWQMLEDSSSRGERLAWVVMQHMWQEKAEWRPITQMTPPNEVIQFIDSQPGLREICECMPRRLLEFAPQLAIPGMAGSLERRIEEDFQVSIREYANRRMRKDKCGSALTTNGLCPACDEEFALRHPTFGDYEPAMVACGFVQGNGGGMGPHTKAYPSFDFILWLLSSSSDWLPRPHHAYLLQGMKEWIVWPWMGKGSESEYDGINAGALWRQLRNAADGSRDSITLTKDARMDLSDRIQHCRKMLELRESLDDLTDRFMSEQVIETWLSEKRKMRARRQA